MSITVHDSAGTRRIGVLGSATEAGCRTDLLNALDKRGSLGLDLTFYDARILPADVLEKLLKLKADGVSLKIHAYHHYLLLHLMRLNLPAIGVIPACSPAPSPNYAAIALGGSADSLDKVLAIIEALPETNAAIFVAQHIPEDKPSYLDTLLKVRTG